MKYNSKYTPLHVAIMDANRAGVGSAEVSFDQYVDNVTKAQNAGYQFMRRYNIPKGAVYLRVQNGILFVGVPKPAILQLEG